MSIHPVGTQPRSEANRPAAPNVTTHLVASLSLLALTAMTASFGLARVFFSEALPPWPPVALLAGSAVVGTVCGWRALRTVQELPAGGDDCERYGRHMVGLTFVLLVLGLSNAVGTSTLAFDGGLGFSATKVIEASDPAGVDKADKDHEAALAKVKLAEREKAKAQRDRTRKAEQVERSCSGRPEQQASDALSCQAARVALVLSEEALVGRANEHTDAVEKMDDAKSRCTLVRHDAKHALFFLLSLSTMMSLFGASFYVVNRMRAKRPRITSRGTGEGNPAGDAETSAPISPSEFPGAPSSASPSSGSPFWAGPPSDAGRRNASTNVAEEPDAAPGRRRDVEPFDAHAFWSGAFFRIGEAILFNFAFFWLIWTSNRRTEVIWLPVLGLFVGMFVKTGEAIIFRLGMRVLSAIEALLPTAALPAREPKPGPEQGPTDKRAPRTAARGPVNAT